MKHSLYQSIPAKMCPEAELLVCCARIRFDPQITERIHALTQNGIDWNFLLEGASKHRVMPLVSRSLEKLRPQAAPDLILDQLQAYSAFNTRRNLFFSGKLTMLLNQLKENNIFAMPFKGPALAEYVYGDLSLRQFDDLDILIHERDSICARDILISSGYRPEVSLKDSQYKVFVKTKNSAKFCNANDRIEVDLHWEMTGRYSLMPFDLGSLKGRLVPATLAGKKIVHLCPEDLVLYLCHHGNMHCWKTLEMICSVAELIRSKFDMDWLRVTDMAAKLRCERILFLGLFMAHDLLGAPLPDYILKTAETDPRVRELATVVYQNLFLGNSGFSKNEINYKFSLFHIKVRERLSEKVRHILHIVTNPTKEEWRILPIPAFLSVILFVLRPVRLAVGLIGVFVNKVFEKIQIKNGECESSRS